MRRKLSNFAPRYLLFLVGLKCSTLEQTAVCIRKMTEGYLLFFTEGLCLMFFSIMCILFLFFYEGRVKKLMVGCMIFWVCLHLKELFVITNFDFTLMTVERARKSIDSLALPTCAFVALELVHPGWYKWWRCLLHYSLFVFFCLAALLSHNLSMFYMMLVFVICYGIGMSIYGLMQVPRYDKLIKDKYSFTEHLSLSWLYYAMVFFISILFMWLCACFKLDLWADSIFHMLSMTLWAIVCFNVYYQRDLTTDDITDYEMIDDTKLHSSEPQPDDDDQMSAVVFEEKLQTIFVDAKLFLDPTLKLTDVARILGTNRTYLSNFLNNEKHTTFYDFVNELRLQHACMLLRTTTLTLDLVGEQSGFNSLSTFRRAFIRQIGVTPHAYRMESRDTQ